MPTAVKMSHAPDIQWSHSFRGPGELGMGVAWTGHSKKNSNVMGSSRTHARTHTHVRNTHTQSHSNTDRHCMHYTTTHGCTHIHTHTLQPMSGAWPHENTLFWRRWMEAPKSYTSCHKHWRDNNDTNRCVQCVRLPYNFRQSPWESRSRTASLHCLQSETTPPPVGSAQRTCYLKSIQVYVSVTGIWN